MVIRIKESVENSPKKCYTICKYSYVMGRLGFCETEVSKKKINYKTKETADSILFKVSHWATWVNVLIGGSITWRLSIRLLGKEN